VTSEGIYAAQDEERGCKPRRLPSIPQELIDQFVRGPMGAAQHHGRLGSRSRTIENR
jgi:hypothetical protein